MTTEGKAAALLHGQILEAADDGRIYCNGNAEYFTVVEKENKLLLF